MWQAAKKLGMKYTRVRSLLSHIRDTLYVLHSNAMGRARTKHTRCPTELQCTESIHIIKYRKWRDMWLNNIRTCLPPQQQHSVDHHHHSREQSSASASECPPINIGSVPNRFLIPCTVRSESWTRSSGSEWMMYSVCGFFPLSFFHDTLFLFYRRTRASLLHRQKEELLLNLFLKSLHD